VIVKKIHFEIDKTNKAKLFKKSIFKKYVNHPARDSDVIVVIGGDGFMLQILKKYQKYKKPFYGMNRGTFGFLMNKFKLQNIYKKISRAKPVSISPLEMKATTKENKTVSAYAINEVSLLRQSKQTSSLQILDKKRILIKKLIADGVLVSTPAGSTAYNLSIHGPILSLNSKKIAVTPISPFRPRRWKGKIVPSSSIIKIINLETKKRPVSVVADNVEVRNIKSVQIKINNLIKFKLLYDRNSILTKKIKLEQIRKETI
jgi:NAD+ kinase